MPQFLAPAAIVEAVDEENDDFCFGSFNVGVLFDYGEESYGWGLFLAIDHRRPNPGLMLVIGPLAFDLRWNDYAELRLLKQHLWGWPVPPRLPK